MGVVRQSVTACIGWRLIACLVLCTVPVSASSQDDDDAPIPTLRVYTNLLQIPTLVLDSQRRPIPKIAEGRFLVSIDSGPKSHVAHARQEGDDPIALAILVDVARIPSGTRSRLVEAIVGLGQSSLRSVDSVSLYGLDCQLSRAVVARPVTAAGLRQDAELLFGKATAHGFEPCRQQRNLLDAIVSAVQGLQDEPGRRVLLVLSDGQDRGSRTSWDAGRAYSSEKGVAIFASIPPSGVNMPVFSTRGGVLGVQSVSAVSNLPAFCESTGGMALDSTSNVGAQMRDFVALVRGRYIVEFPRPDTGAGNHELEVTVEKLNAFIRPAGASVPLADPDLAKDPNTILTGPSGAPEVGTKRPKQ